MSDVEKQPLLDEFPAEKQAHLEDELQLQIQAAAAKKERQVRTVRTWFYIFYFGMVFWLVGGSQFLNNLLPSRPYVSHRTPFMAALDAYITNVNKLSAELDPASTLSASEPVSAKNLAQAIEKAFLAVPDAESARGALRRYTAVTHIAGSEEDYKSAIQVTSEWAELLGADFAEDTHVFDAGSSESQDFIKGDWKKKGPFGSPFVKPRAFVDTYYTWINFPINSSLVLYPEPTEGSNEKPEPKYTFKLKEDVLDKDPTSDKGEPQFHGYSKSGSVTGPIVYANQGSKEDFARLHALGVNTTGAIALVRYGDSFRGLKVRASADAGCVATIIYSDLAEDNNVTEANGYKAYPDGPARNPSSVQRGSVMALSVYAGDPSTPGQPSYENATRLDPESAESLPTIPSIPLSYADAKILFESIKGNGVSPDHKGLGKDWSGAIPGVEYWTGPSKEVAHLTNYQDLKTRKIWNGYAIIPGFIDDEVVVIGNHRDAWTFGAVDPNSGTAAFHEIVAGLGHLVKKGWRPLRTIIVASWDAEEYGLVGSTEFGEDFASWLSKNAAIYHNLDVSVAGPSLMVGASPSLVDLFNGTAKEVPHPDIEGKNMTIEALVDLGSGSDFTVFLQYLGIASSTVGYSQDVGAPIYHYHSNYDSFAWMENFGDPKFTRHLAIARYLGLITLRSASDIFLPINITRYADELQKYLDEASEIVVKSPQTLAGAVDFEPLQEAVDAVKKGARVLEDDKARAKRKFEKLWNHHKGQQHEHRHHHHHHGDDHRHKHEKRGEPGVGCAHHKKKRDVRGELREIYELIRSVNKRAQAFERGFISEEGLTGREWYKHLGVAPGRWLGYGATTFPGLKEALALDAGKGAKHEAKRLEKLLLDIAKMLHKGGVDEERSK